MNKHSALIIPLLLFILTSCKDDPEIIINPFQEPDASSIWHGFDNGSEYIVVMGDVQSYVASRNYLPYFRCSMQWIAQEMNKGVRMKGLLFTGDATDNNSIEQWNIFHRTTLIAAKELLTVVCPGNHDYEWNRKGHPVFEISARESSHLSQYASFPHLKENIVASFEEDRLDNIVVRLTVNSHQLSIMSLEFSPRPEVILWAEEWITSHPDERFILMTHELLSETGTVITSGSFGSMQFGSSGVAHSEPVEITERLLKPFPNVIMALCGHNAFDEECLIKREDGGTAPILLFNLQYLENGGNGIIELLEFPETGDEIRVHIISTVTGNHVKPSRIYHLCL